jgi:hypothetical protein
MGRRTREAIAQVFDTHGVDVNPANWKRLKRRRDIAGNSSIRRKLEWYDLSGMSITRHGAWNV